MDNKTRTTKVDVPLTKKEEDLHFENGFFLSSYHEQECCERVYASFTEAEDTLWESPFNIHHKTNLKAIVEVVPDYGIRLKDANGCLHNIPCYNIQNGCYSGNSELRLRDYRGKIVSVLGITEAANFIDG